jgi:hypothetical protein
MDCLRISILSLFLAPTGSLKALPLPITIPFFFMLSIFACYLEGRYIYIGMARLVALSKTNMSKENSVRNLLPALILLRVLPVLLSSLPLKQNLPKSTVSFFSVSHDFIFPSRGIIKAIRKVKFSLCLINYAPCHEDVWGVDV